MAANDRAAAVPLFSRTRWTPVQVLKLLVATALIVPVLIFAAAAAYDRSRVLNEADRRVEQTTRLLDEHAAKVFETLDLVMTQVLLRIEGRDWESIYQDRALFEELNSIRSALPQVDGIFLVGPTGRTWMTSRVFPAPAGTDFSDRDYFVAHRDGDAGTFISKTYLGKISKHPIFNVSRSRSGPGGEFDGVVGISVSLAYFENFYAALAHDTDHAAALTRADGALLVRYPQSEDRLLRWPDGAPIMQAIADRPSEGRFEVTSRFDGIARLVRYKRLDSYPLYVSYGISKAGALSEWYDDLVVFGVFAGLASIGLSLLTLVALARTRQAERAFAGLRETADSLRREQEFSGRLIRSSREGIFAIDREMRMTVSNPALEHITGLGEEKLIGRPVLEVFNFEGGALADGLRRSVQGQEGAVREVSYSVPDSGRKGYLDAHYSPLRSSGGEVIGGIAFVIETTEQRRAAEALRQSQKMEAVGQLTGGIAHDFNNLLTVILGNLDRLQSRLGQSEARAVAAIRRAAERGEALTKHMLAFARRQPLRPEPFELNQKLQEIAAFLRQSLPPNIEVRLELNPGLSPVEADPEQLEVAVINLATNARDAMPNGGVLTLGTSIATRSPASPDGAAERRYVALLVSDTGAGIPAEVRERVFDPFFTTKEIGKGTGLGLSRVYGFARQSGGSVELESEIGKGTAVTLLLPVFGEPAGLSRPTLVAGDAGPDLQLLNAQILLVEDEAEVADVIIDMLQGLGCTVTWVRGAAECRALPRGGTELDAAITDIFMPGETGGVALAKELRQRRPGMPVVLITGSGQAALEALADGFQVVQKPFTRAALGAALHEALGRAQDRRRATAGETG
jgi:PAS domain S-box-containing protein